MVEGEHVDGEDAGVTFHAGGARTATRAAVAARIRAPRAVRAAATWSAGLTASSNYPAVPAQAGTFPRATPVDTAARADRTAACAVPAAALARAAAARAAGATSLRLVLV